MDVGTLVMMAGPQVASNTSAEHVIPSERKLDWGCISPALQACMLYAI